MLGKNVALRDHGELNPRILKSLENPSVISHYLARPQHSSRIFAVKRSNEIIPKVLDNSFCPRSGTREDKHSVAFFHITLKVTHERIEAVIIRRDASCVNVPALFRRKEIL